MGKNIRWRIKQKLPRYHISMARWTISPWAWNSLAPALGGTCALGTFPSLTTEGSKTYSFFSPFMIKLKPVENHVIANECINNEHYPYTIYTLLNESSSYTGFLTGLRTPDITFGRQQPDTCRCKNRHIQQFTGIFRQAFCACRWVKVFSD